LIPLVLVIIAFLAGALVVWLFRKYHLNETNDVSTLFSMPILSVGIQHAPASYVFTFFTTIMFLLWNLSIWCIASFLHGMGSLHANWGQQHPTLINFLCFVSVLLGSTGTILFTATAVIPTGRVDPSYTGPEWEEDAHSRSAVASFLLTIAHQAIFTWLYKKMTGEYKQRRRCTWISVLGMVFFEARKILRDKDCYLGEWAGAAWLILWYGTWTPEFSGDMPTCSTVPKGRSYSFDQKTKVFAFRT